MVIFEVLVSLFLFILFLFFVTQVILPLVQGTPLFPILRGGLSTNKELEEASREVEQAREEIKVLDVKSIAKSYTKQIKTKRARLTETDQEPPKE